MASQLVPLGNIYFTYKVMLQKLLLAMYEALLNRKVQYLIVDMLTYNHAVR